MLNANGEEVWCKANGKRRYWHNAIFQPQKITNSDFDQIFW